MQGCTYLGFSWESVPETMLHIMESVVHHLKQASKYNLLKQFAGYVCKWKDWVVVASNQFTPTFIENNNNNK